MAELRPENVRYIIVHDTGVATDQSAAQIDAYHRNVRHYDQIGYHWVVRKNGEVEPGRPENIVGAHVAGNTTIPRPNSQSIGIAMTGNLGVNEAPRAQRDALVDKVARLCITYNVPVANVRGHGEIEPGNSDLPVAQMDKFRPLVEARIAAIRQEQGAGRETSRMPTPPASRPTVTPETAHTTLDRTALPRAASPAAATRAPAPAAPPSSGSPSGHAVHPLPTRPTVQPSAEKVQTFGAARGSGPAHNGSDYSAPVGTRVGAIDGGTVVAVVRDASPGRREGAGNYVVVRHDGTGMHSVYEHLQDGSFAVQAGQRVAAGQTLGNVGMTGNTTGPHLHLSVFAGGNEAAFAAGRFARRATGATMLDPARVVGHQYTALPGLRAPQPGAPQAGPPQAAGTAVPRDLLKVGMEGPDVRALQHRLAGLGYGARVGTIDGVFDAGLAAVVKQFQADRGLPEKYQTGNAGPVTRREMDDAVRENDRDGRAPVRSPVTTLAADTAPARPPATPSGDGARGTSPTVTAPTATPPAAAAPSTRPPAPTPLHTKAPTTDAQYSAATAVFLREADQAVSNVLDRHVADVPGALAALVRDTRGPGAGPLGATTPREVQQAFERFTSGDATARPLSVTEAAMIAPVLDERTRLIAEGAVPVPATLAPATPSGDGATAPVTAPAHSAADTAPRL